jgi:hypothetical protein
MGLGPILLLGLVAGATILLGLLVGRLRRRCAGCSTRSRSACCCSWSGTCSARRGNRSTRRSAGCTRVRAAWRRPSATARMAPIEPDRLVVVDECGTRTSLTRRRARGAGRMRQQAEVHHQAGQLVASAEGGCRRPRPHPTGCDGSELPDGAHCADCRATRRGLRRTDRERSRRSPAASPASGTQMGSQGGSWPSFRATARRSPGGESRLSVSGPRRAAWRESPHPALPRRRLPRATGQQPEAVEADEDGGAFVAGNTQRQG